MYEMYTKMRNITTTDIQSKNILSHRHKHTKSKLFIFLTTGQNLLLFISELVKSSFFLSFFQVCVKLQNARARELN